MTVLPYEETWKLIAKFSSSFSAYSSKFRRLNMPSITSIWWNSRFSKNKFFKRNSSLFNDLFVSSFNKRFRTFDKESFIIIVSILYLIVELNIIPSNEMSNFLFYLIISLVIIKSTWEVRSLRSMSKNDVLVFNLFTQSFLESNNIICTWSFLNSIIVFIININTINMRILVDKIS